MHEITAKLIERAPSATRTELVHSEEPTRNSGFNRPDVQNNCENVSNVNGRNMNTLLRVGKVRIHGPRGVEEVFALFDEGSSLSMMDAAVAESVGLRGPVAPVSFRWTNGILHKEEQSMMLLVSHFWTFCKQNCTK
ncbi:AAEL006913-PA [Aedes aegypti]|uniref:AAEL006913-PA n=1 Tax=Aedes aegypti TaxID=7159 RepID=Q174F1_AEDAE|nr:AAEL006913-PA [Aedes aegypti]